MLLVVLICFDDHAAVSSDAAHLAQCGMLRASPDASGTPAGQVFVAYCPGGCHGHQCCVWNNGHKTQLLAYHLRRKPIVDFCDGTNKSDSDDIMDEECSIFNVKTL